MMLEDWRNLAVVASIFAGLIAIGLLIVLRLDRRRRLAVRPNWERMLADKEAARGLPVDLHDGKQLAEWMADIWA